MFDGRVQTIVTNESIDENSSFYYCMDIKWSRADKVICTQNFLGLGEIKNDTLTSLIHPDDLNKFNQMYEDAKNNNFYSSTMSMLMKTGGYIDVEAKFLPTNHKKSFGFIVRKVDKTANTSEQNRELLKVAYELYCDELRIVLLNLNNGMSSYLKMPKLDIYDMDVTDYYDGEEQIPFEYWIENVASNFVHDDYRSEFLATFNINSIRNSFSEGKKTISLIYKRLCTSRDYYDYVKASIKAYRKDGFDNFAVIYVSSISDDRVLFEQYRKLLEKSNETLILKNKLLSEYISFIPSGLKNYMLAISKLNETLKNAEGNEKKIKQIIKKQSDAVSMEAKVLYDIKEIALGRGTELVNNVSLYNISNLKDSLIDYFSYLNNDKNITIMLRGEFEGKYYFDMIRLKSILYYLIDNSMNLNINNGSLKIECNVSPFETRNERNYDEVTFNVADSSLGFDEKTTLLINSQIENKDNIVLADNTNYAVRLNVVRQLCELIGAKLVIYSTPGVGVRAEVILALEQFNDNVSFSGASTSDVATEENDKTLEVEVQVPVKVLIVDNNEINLKLTKHILTQEGYVVEGCIDAENAVDKFLLAKEEPFDLILADVAMPEIDGYTFAKMIRGLKVSNAKKVKIIAMSSLTSEEYVKKAYESQMNAFLPAPFELAEFTRIAKELL